MVFVSFSLTFTINKRRMGRSQETDNDPSGIEDVIFDINLVPF